MVSEHVCPVGFQILQRMTRVVEDRTGIEIDVGNPVYIEVCADEGSVQVFQHGAAEWSGVGDFDPPEQGESGNCRSQPWVCAKEPLGAVKLETGEVGHERYCDTCEEERERSSRFLTR